MSTSFSARYIELWIFIYTCAHYTLRMHLFYFCSCSFGLERTTFNAKIEQWSRTFEVKCGANLDVCIGCHWCICLVICWLSQVIEHSSTPFHLQNECVILMLLIMLAPPPHRFHWYQHRFSGFFRAVFLLRYPAVCFYSFSRSICSNFFCIETLMTDVLCCRNGAKGEAASYSFFLALKNV